MPSWWPRTEPGEIRSAAVADLVSDVRRSLVAGEAATARDAVAASAEVPARLWRALTVVHAELDRALAAGAPLEEVEPFRERLLEFTRDAGEAITGPDAAAYRQLLADSAHDIRSPLNSILFLADGLRSEDYGDLNPVQRRQIGVVYSAAAALRNLVNDLLDFARFSPEELERATSVPFSLESVLSDVRQLVGPIADHHGSRLETDVAVEGPRVGDPHVLCRVLLNLVSNALEATWEGGEVTVRVREEDAGETLRVEVEDDGDGIDVQRARELIGAQSHGRATRMLRGQTRGVGLVMCGRKVRAAGGELEVERREDRGTRFTLRLPYPAA